MKRTRITATAIATLCLLAGCSGTNGSATSRPNATQPAGNTSSASVAGSPRTAPPSSIPPATAPSTDASVTDPSSNDAAGTAQSAGTATSSEPELPTVDVRSVPGNPQAIVDRIRRDRLMKDITEIATGPRNVNDNHAAALRAARYVSKQFSATGLKPNSVAVDAMGTTLPTVWVSIPGKRCADTVFVVTGHYDTVPGSPGADDDASGVAAVLEMARVLRTSNLPATVVLGAVPFEEQGMPYYGAAALADALQASNKKIIGMVSAEMLGYALPKPSADGDPGNYLYLLGYPDAAGLVATFSSAGNAWAHGFTNAAGTSTPAEGYITRSDHAAFHELGIPAAFATDGADRRTPYYHTSEDTVAHIDKDFLLGSVRTLTGGVVAAATLGVAAGTAGGACG